MLQESLSLAVKDLKWPGERTMLLKCCNDGQTFKHHSATSFSLLERNCPSMVDKRVGPRKVEIK